MKCFNGNRMQCRFKFLVQYSFCFRSYEPTTFIFFYWIEFEKFNEHWSDDQKFYGKHFFFHILRSCIICICEVVLLKASLLFSIAFHVKPLLFADHLLKYWIHFNRILNRIIRNFEKKDHLYFLSLRFVVALLFD